MSKKKKGIEVLTVGASIEEAEKFLEEYDEERRDLKKAIDKEMEKHGNLLGIAPCLLDFFRKFQEKDEEAQQMALLVIFSFGKHLGEAMAAWQVGNKAEA